MPEDRKPVRARKAIMIRPEPALLEAMQDAAEKQGISLNKLALEIIESSGRLGANRASASKAEVYDALTEVERAIRRLKAAIE